MENENLEQPEIELVLDNRETHEITAPINSNEASEISERFTSVGDLLKSYKNLRAEFTRKSQRLKQLEQEIANNTTPAGAAEEAVKNVSQIQNQQLQAGQSLESLQAHTEVQTSSALSVKNQSAQFQPIQVQSAGTSPVQQTDNDKGKSFAAKPEDIIKEYLLSVAASKKAPAVIAAAGTDFVFTNVSEAKSINATTKAAEYFFINKGKC